MEDGKKVTFLFYDDDMIWQKAEYFIATDIYLQYMNSANFEWHII